MQMTNLTSLDLTLNDTITDQAVLALTNLKSLALHANEKINGTVLGQLPLLEKLDIYCEYDNTQLPVTNEHLAPCTRLVSLKLSCHPVTDISTLTGLQELVWRGKNDLPSDDQISRLVHLTSLVIEGQDSVTDESIKLLTNLVKLSFVENEGITFDSIRQLEKLTSLEPNEQISGESIIVLTGLKRLAMNEDIYEEDLMKMPFLTDLKASHLITVEALQALTNLTRLNLNDTGELCEDEVPAHILELKMF